MFTISDFLNLNCANDSIIISGNNSLSTTIEHIAVIEAPVEDFIREKELVLTTAIGCLEDEDLLLEFLRDIHDSGAACVGLALKEKNYSFPKKVLKYLENTSFPVLLIPWECRFSEIIENVIEEINIHREKNRRFYESIQNKLLSIYLQNKGISLACNSLSKYLKIPLLITNSDFKIKASSIKINKDKIVDLTEDNCKVLFSIKINNILHGYVMTETEKYFEINKAFTNFLTLPLSLWFNHEEIIDSTKLQVTMEFVWNLATKENKDYSHLKSKGRILGYNIEKTYVCILGQVRNTHGDSQLRDSIDNSIMVKLLKEFNQVKKNYPKEQMTVYKDSTFLIFREVDEMDNNETINKYIDTLDRKVSNLYKDLEIIWGISQINTSKADFNELFKNAKSALDVFWKTNSKKKRFSYEDSNLFYILKSLKNIESIDEIVSSTMDKLCSKDKNKILVETLRSYFNNDRNVSKTARSLHIHRQSLLYRLDRIQKLTNLNIENTDHLFLLEICVRLSNN
jgi:purine catabolism regulator